MKKSLIYKEVILPQAWRRAIPPVWNSLIDIVKASSLASVLTISELTYNADQIAASNFKVLPILLTAAFIYWFFTTILISFKVFLRKNCIFHPLNRRIKELPNRQLFAMSSILQLNTRHSIHMLGMIEDGGIHASLLLYPSAFFTDSIGSYATIFIIVLCFSSLIH